MTPPGPSPNPSPGTLGKLVVVSGPSGVGKSTINRQVVQRTDAQFSVSATTRPKRPGETEGQDYYFVDRPAFEEMIRRDTLLEWAEVFGNLYGTPIEPVRQAVREGRSVLLEIDVQGGLQVKRKMPEAVSILIVPPAMDVLRDRLEQRGTEDAESMARRLGKATSELDMARQSGAYEHEVVNDDLETAIEAVVSIVENETGERKST